MVPRLSAAHVPSGKAVVGRCRARWPRVLVEEAEERPLAAAAAASGHGHEEAVLHQGRPVVAPGVPEGRPSILQVGAREVGDPPVVRGRRVRHDGVIVVAPRAVTEASVSSEAARLHLPVRPMLFLSTGRSSKKTENFIDAAPFYKLTDCSLPVVTAAEEMPELVGEGYRAGEGVRHEGHPSERGTARLEQGPVVRHAAVLAGRRRRHQDGHVGAAQHILGRLNRAVARSRPFDRKIHFRINIARHIYVDLDI